MLYSYEEWTDPENGEVEIHQHEVTRSCYTHLHNFVNYRAAEDGAASL